MNRQEYQRATPGAELGIRVHSVMTSAAIADLIVGSTSFGM
jgi:hypothetical protein